MYELGFEEAEESEIKLTTAFGSWIKQGVAKKIYFCFIDYDEAFAVWITTNWKILKEMRWEYQTT